MNFNPDFKSVIKSLSIDTDSFLESLSTPHQTTIRRHAIKSNNNDYKHLDSVPWCKHAYTLPERPHFNKEPSFLTGEYYVQESSSMFLHHVLGQIQLPETPLVLDACAAPGGKSTIILDHLKGQGTLIANEVIRSRAKVLSENLVKWGYHNYVITNSDLSKFNNSALFDLVLIDAPCSGEGLFRRDPSAMQHWSLDHVNHCAARQKRILSDTAGLIKSGGYLIYSTCTYNKRENEEQIDFLIKEHDFEYHRIDCNEEWKIMQSELGLRFFPHLINGEGLFMAVLRKNQSQSRNENENMFADRQKHNVNSFSKKDLQMISQWTGHEDPGLYKEFQDGIVMYSGHVAYEYFKKQRIYSFGRHLGKIIYGELRPHPHFAFSLEFHNKLRQQELKRSDIIQLMDRNLVNSLGESGWTLLTYRSNGLYWAKTVKNKYKVQYPKF